MSTNQAISTTEDSEPTLHDVLGAINQLSTHMDSEIGSLKSGVTSLKIDMTTVKSEINHIKSVMVTKDYLDDKLYNLKGDLITLTRKEDHKVVALTEELLHNRVISEQSAKRILALESFPQ